MSTYKERYEERKKNKSGDTYQSRYLKRKVERGELDIDAVGKDLSNRVNTWLDNNQKYFTEANTRFSGDNSVYRADASDWLNSATSRNQTFQTEADNIKKDLDYYAPLLGQDYVDSVLKALDGNIEAHKSILDAANKDVEYWSQWDNEDAWKADYDAYLAQEEQKKANLEYDLAAGKTKIADLEKQLNSIGIMTSPDEDFVKTMRDAYELFGWGDKARLEELEKHMTATNELQELLENERQRYAAAELAQKSESYNALTKGGDFALKSQPVSKYVGGEKYNNFANQYVNLGYADYDDLLHGYINGEPAARRVVSTNDMQNGGTFWGYDNSQLLEMTADEVSIYNYVYNTQGKEAAKEYLNFIMSDLNARKRAKEEEYWAAEADESPILSSIFSVASSPLKTFSFIGQTADLFADGSIDQNAGYNKFAYSNTAIRNEVSKKIEEKWGGVGSFAYQTGMSMADFLLNTAITGGNSAFSLGIMGSSAAADTVISAKDRGLSDSQAYSLGIIAGAAEIITEKVSIEALLDKTTLGKNALEYVLKNVLSEGGEEVSSSVINLVADVLISKDKSEWQALINEYKRQDMDDQKAFWHAVGDQALSLGLDFLGGAISGGVMGGGGVALNAIGSTVQESKNANALFGNYAPELISRAFEVGDPKVKALAESYQKKLDAGKKISGAELNKLARAVTGRTSASTRTESNAKTDATASDPLEALALKVRLDRVSRKESSATENPAEKKNAVKTEFEVSADGKTIYHSARGDVETSVKEIASIKDGKVEVMIDGGEVVDAKDLSFASEDEAMLYSMVADMGVDAQTANALIKGFDASDGVSARDYAIDIPMAYALGKINDRSGLRNLKLTDSQSTLAFVLGHDAEMSKARARAEQLAAENGSETSGNVSEAKGENTSEENVVYSSKKAKAVDAVPINKYDGNQKHVALVGLQIGRKVVYARTMNEKGIEVDGFLGTDGVIYINPNNPNPLAFVFKHELAHFCERAGQKYRDFVNTVRFSETFKNWLRGKGFESELEYNSQIRRERTEIGQTLDEESATREIMANFVGDVLFGDNTELAEGIISELEPKPRKSFVDYIRDFISWLKRKLQGNSSRARNEIQKLESKLASAYQAAVESGANTRESFLISQSLEGELDKLLKGTFDASRNEIYLGETSNFMTDVIGAQALRLYMPASKAYSALVTEEEYSKKPYYSKRDNYHGIGKANFIEILKKSETPIAAFAASADEKGNKRQNRIILVTDKLIRDAQNGKDGYAVVVEEVDAEGLRNGKRINANKAITIYPRMQLLKDIQDAIIDGRILDITKKGEHLFAGVRGSNPQAAIRKDVLKKNIAHFWENVKWESEKNKTYSSTETPTPTPMQAAFMKAGYIDQDGHIKDMQESEESSQNGENEQFSYTSRDSEYLSAVERGDMETAQRMVNEVAKKAGYEEHLYHGTNADFTKFDLRKHGGRNGKGEGYGIYLAANREISAPYGKNVIDSYVKFNRLAEGRKKTLSYNEVKNLVKRSCEIEAQRMVDDEEYDSVSEALRDTWVSNIVYTYNYSNIEQVYADVANKLWNENDNDGDLINEIMALSGAHYDYNNALDFYDNILTPVTGIDGFHYIWGNKDGSGEQNDIYLAFRSEQIKSADPVTYDDNGNVIPLSERFDEQEDDIRFSYTPRNDKIENIFDRVRNGELSLDEAETLLKKPAKENPATIASLTPEDMKTTPKLAKKTGEAKGDGESRFHGSLQRSSIFDKKFKEEAKKDNFIKHYSAITNEDTLKEAARLLDEGGEAYVEDWKNKRTVEMSTVDTVVGFILLKRYQEVGNYEGAMAVAQKVREVGTLSGQRVQAFSIIGRYDADMMQAYAQKELAEAWEKAVIGKSEKWSAAHKAQFELTDEEIAFIRDNILYAAKLPEGSREKAIALAQITTLIQDKIPPVKGQSYKAWQRVSMLLNPKTQVRNILGNAVMVPVFVASDWFSAPLDMALSRITGVRTTGFTGTRGNRENLKAMGRGLFESYDDWKRHINTRQHDLNRFEIGQGKSFDETKWGRIAKMMNSADKFTSFLLDAGDRTFYELWFTNSLNEQMRLNKVTEPTEAMVQTAIDEALERTWQDDNAMTKMVENIKAGANKISIGGYGLGDVLIKFSKTPANLTKAIYEFSPAAIATLVPQAVTLTRAIKTGTVTPVMQKRFVSSFGKMAAGTMLYVVFAALYNAGRISGASDEDDDVAAFEKYIQGIPEYSVKIGHKWFSYDWAQPIGAVPAIIADFMESRKEGDLGIEDVVDAFKVGGEVLFNQSFMTSLRTLCAADSFMEGLVDAIYSDITVPIPTLFSQVANVFDDKRRVTYDSTSEWQSAINRAILKFPGLRNRLTPDVDIFGREVKNSQQDWFNAFFNPANVYTDTSSEVSDHVYEIYKSTGDASAIPAKAPYHSDLQGVKKKLNDSERADYQRAMGATASEMIEALLQNDVYLAMNDEYKLAVLKTVYSYAATVAKSELDWYNSYEVIHGISKHVTKSDFEAMGEEERIKIVDDYLFSDYNGMYNIETDEGKANYFVNQKTPGAVLSATMNGDIDAAKKLLNGIDERVKSYGWDKVDTEAEIKERKSTVRRTLTTYWKAAYINAYYKKNDAEKEKIRKTLIAIGLYGDSSDVRKTLREWIEAYEEEN